MNLVILTISKFIFKLLVEMEELFFSIVVIVINLNLPINKL